MPLRDPIRDEIARDELNTLGLLYFIDVRVATREILAGLPWQQRSAFAATVAERLIREHHAASTPGDSPDVLVWRRGVDAVWRGLRRHERDVGVVCHVVGDFYLSSYQRDGRRDDPADATDHTVMAALYACECYVHGCHEFAVWAGWRGFDVATVHAAHDTRWPHRRPTGISPYAWELAHPAVQAELGRQLADLELIDDGGTVLLDAHADPGVLLDRLRTGDQDRDPDQPSMPA